MAIIDENGEVVYHSDNERIGYENFFAEADRDRDLRSAVLARRAAHVSAKYWGEDKSMYVRPLAGSAWTLVTFRSKRLPHVLEPTLHHLVGDLDRRRRHVDSGDIAQRHLRHHADGGLESGRAAALELQNLYVGILDRVDRALLERLADDRRDHRLDHLLAEHRGADASFDQRARRAAGAEAFDLRFRCKAVQNPFIGGVDSLGGHLDGHADLALRQLFRDD
jgi:hypothetical protein